VNWSGWTGTEDKRNGEEWAGIDDAGKAGALCLAESPEEKYDCIVKLRPDFNETQVLDEEVSLIESHLRDVLKSVLAVLPDEQLS
jgi:hypothetical protein